MNHSGWGAAEGFGLHVLLCTCWDCAGILASITQVKPSSIKWGTCKSPAELIDWCKETSQCEYVAPILAFETAQKSVSPLPLRTSSFSPGTWLMREKNSREAVAKSLFLIPLPNKWKLVVACRSPVTIFTFFTDNCGCPLWSWTARINPQ